jgi:hypothetical protein
MALADIDDTMQPILMPDSTAKVPWFIVQISVVNPPNKEIPIFLIDRPRRVLPDDLSRDSLIDRGVSNELVTSGKGGIHGNKDHQIASVKPIPNVWTTDSPRDPSPSLLACLK